MTKAFKVNAEWLEYAHGPAAEEEQPLAVDLMALAQRAAGLAFPTGSVLIPADRADLVREVLSVAELYTSDSSVQEDARLWWRAYPRKVVERARGWLREHAPAAPKVPRTTSAQRMEALRLRRAMLGLQQLCVFAHPEDHAALRAYAAKLQAKREAA